MDADVYGEVPPDAFRSAASLQLGEAGDRGPGPTAQQETELHENQRGDGVIRDLRRIVAQGAEQDHVDLARQPEVEQAGPPGGHREAGDRRQRGLR